MALVSLHTDVQFTQNISLTNTISILSKSSPLWQLHQKNLTIPEGCIVLDTSSLGFIPWDNPDNIISQETEQIVDTAVGTVCLPILFVISVPCNILNMLVFWTQGLKERVNLCLFCLSLVDFLHMLMSFLFNFEKIRLPFQVSTSFGPVMEFIVGNFLVGFVRCFNFISGFISMLIASERCLCVVSPLRSQTFLKTRTTAVIIATAAGFILLGTLMMGLRWSLKCIFDPATNTTTKTVYTSDIYRQHKAHLDVMSFFAMTFQLFVYITVVSVTTTVTSVKLKKMMAWREQSSSSTLSSREVALTRMLIAISILYIVCSLPIITSGICVMFVPNIGFSGRYYNLSNFLVSMIELASFINATLNFFIYCFLGSRFKETLRKLLCFKSLSKENPKVQKQSISTSFATCNP